MAEIESSGSQWERLNQKRQLRFSESFCVTRCVVPQGSTLMITEKLFKNLLSLLCQFLSFPWQALKDGTSSYLTLAYLLDAVSPLHYSS